jgi:hypothetical protein
MFRAFVKTIKSIFNIIVFGFLKEVINKVTLNKRLRVITS